MPAPVLQEEPLRIHLGRRCVKNPKLPREPDKLQRLLDVAGRASVKRAYKCGCTPGRRRAGPRGAGAAAAAAAIPASHSRATVPPRSAHLQRARRRGAHSERSNFLHATKLRVRRGEECDWS
eukprot:6175223-Pleurochrysis_carterae.AAC.3